jgi:hypothetical protein
VFRDFRLVGDVHEDVTEFFRFLVHRTENASTGRVKPVVVTNWPAVETTERPLLAGSVPEVGKT